MNFYHVLIYVDLSVYQYGGYVVKILMSFRSNPMRFLYVISWVLLTIHRQISCCFLEVWRSLHSLVQKKKKKKVHGRFRRVFQMYSRVKKKERLRNKLQNLLQPEDKISLNSRAKPRNFKSWVPAIMGRRGGLCDETAILSSKGVKNSSSRRMKTKTRYHYR